MAGIFNASKSELISKDFALAKVMNTPVPSPSKELRVAINEIGQGREKAPKAYSAKVAKEAKNIMGGLNQAFRNFSIKIGNQTLIAGAPIKSAQNIAATLKGPSPLKAIASLSATSLRQTPKISR